MAYYINKLGLCHMLVTVTLYMYVLACCVFQLIRIVGVVVVVLVQNYMFYFNFVFVISRFSDVGIS